MKKKHIVMIVALLFVIALCFIIGWFFLKAPELKNHTVSNMSVTITTENGADKVDLTQEDIASVCDWINQMPKKFLGIFEPGAGWDVLINYSNGDQAALKQISIVENKIIYHGIIDRSYTVSAQAIEEFKQQVGVFTKVSEDNSGV